VFGFFPPGIPLSNRPILDTARDLTKMKNTISGLAPQPITELPEHENLHIGYNVTHDAGLIAIAFEAGKTSEKQGWIDPPAHRIGVDVMRLSIPDRFTFQAFVETVGDAVRTFNLVFITSLHPPSAVPFPHPDFPKLPVRVDVRIVYDSFPSRASFFFFETQLTPYEKETLSPTPAVSSSESLYHFYLIWTLKEAYTKALGLGLGFDFKRIEYDKVKNRVKVDGVILKGWTFDIFRVPDPQGKEGGTGGYIGVAAKCVGGKREAVVRRSPESSGLFSLSIMTAKDFMSRALRELE
jgi:hypothetical protein